MPLIFCIQHYESFCNFFFEFSCGFFIVKIFKSMLFYHSNNNIQQEDTGEKNSSSIVSNFDTRRSRV